MFQNEILKKDKDKNEDKDNDKNEDDEKDDDERFLAAARLCLCVALRWGTKITLSMVKSLTIKTKITLSKPKCTTSCTAPPHIVATGFFHRATYPPEETPLPSKTLQELRMLSSVTLNCQVTEIVMNSDCHLSEL